MSAPSVVSRRRHLPRSPRGGPAQKSMPHDNSEHCMHYALFTALPILQIIQSSYGIPKVDMTIIAIF